MKNVIIIIDTNWKVQTNNFTDDKKRMAINFNFCLISFC